MRTVIRTVTNGNNRCQSITSSGWPVGDQVILFWSDGTTTVETKPFQVVQDNGMYKGTVVCQ
jgi:hypothetical protein